MKTIIQNHARSIGRAALVATALTVGMASNAFAANTPSGTSIGNIATIDYKVDNVQQTEIESSAGGNTTPGAGNGTETAFVVGTKINLTLVEEGNTYTSVVAGSLLQATKFTLTNTGNDSQGYTFSAVNTATVPIYGGADDFDVGTFAFYIDAVGGTAGAYDAGDTLITSVPVLAADASLVIYVTASIPAGTANNLQSNISLTAQTTIINSLAALDKAAITISNSAGTTVDLVFADDLADAIVVNRRDGRAIAFDAYTLVTAALTVSKASVVYSDPANGTTNPKAIPGAIITYTISIVNNGTITATDISIADIVTEITDGTVSFKTLYDDGTTACIANQGIAVKDGAITPPAIADCKTSDNADTDVDGAGFTGVTVSATGLTLETGETATMAFQVTIL